MLGKIKNKLLASRVNERVSPHKKVVSLNPEGTVRGYVLLSYVIEPFLLKEGEKINSGHTHHWESFQIAKTFLKHHYAVDVVSYLNRTFVPKRKYDYFISARTNLERIAKYLDDKCVKVAHLDTSHWVYNNLAAQNRVSSLLDRRGVVVSGGKFVEENWAIEAADLATILGNEFTIGTYAYSGKEIHRIPISAPCTYPWDSAKDFDACRKSYIWFGSSGFVHKGLDIVLEAFAKMPDYTLYVCGPFEQERRFLEAFHKELFETPNIRPVGWVDVESKQFLEIARSCVGLVYPSCSEGGGGSAISCMHAGIIPVLSREASVDLYEDYGVLLADSSENSIRDAVESLSSLPCGELRRMAYNAWEFANRNHTREHFAHHYEQFVLEKLLEARA